MLTSGVDQTWAWTGGDYGGGGDIGSFIVSIPSLRTRYGAVLASVAESMRTMDAPGKAAAYQALIAPYLYADPYKEFDMASHDADVVSTEAWAASRPDAILSGIE